MATMEELEKQVAELSHELERIWAVTEIQNLMASYEYWHYPHLFHRKPELFALTMPDVSMDLSNAGIFVGREAIEFVWNQILGKAQKEPGAMFIHPITTPSIQVAKDGQTAKAIWISPGLETYYAEHRHTCPEGHVEGMAPMTAYWCWGKYACDFIKEGGTWKIWHMKWFRDFRCDYYTSWVDDVLARSEISKYQKIDRPDIKEMRYHEPYDPKVRRKALPAIPEPYETFDDPDWIYAGYQDIIPPRE